MNSTQKNIYFVHISSSKSPHFKDAQFSHQKVQSKLQFSDELLESEPEQAVLGKEHILSRSHVMSLSSGPQEGRARSICFHIALSMTTVPHILLSASTIINMQKPFYTHIKQC